MKDVGRLAGVSLGTVSNVLNHPDRVRPATRERVEQAIATLGFVRNESARQLRAGQSRVLAYLVPTTDNTFFTDVARGARRAAAENQLAMFLCSSDEDRDQEVDHLQLLGQQRVQGVLLTPVTRAPAKELAVLRRQGVAVVLVDRAATGTAFCSVAVDDVLGGHLAVSHLLGLGHRRIAFLGSPETHYQVADRLTGARRAIAEADLSPDSLTVITTSEMSMAAGWAAGPEVRRGGARRRPTGAYCANDLLAIGLLQYAVGQRWQVPGDLALVGHDDIQFAAGAAVPLTSVRQPRTELGETAVRLLQAERDEPDHQHQHVTFAPDLVVRASTTA
ncbi:LacI family DNA-binding transcriptional regulator [Microlunatus sp. Y2014]|uniref:LacI family DNA-binding transcriptional regulator n=1 Tax=Microlunatus sp. Y2014 TaxID=3418488 RepID=UPI003B470282